MLKIIFNDDYDHIIQVNNFNYSTTLQIDNYSKHYDNISMSFNADAIRNLNHFENVKITKIEIQNSQSEKISELNFTEDVYMIGYNTNIYENENSGTVNIGRIEFADNQ